MRAWLERGADSDGQSIRPVNVITEGPWCRGWANHTEEEEKEEQEQEQEEQEEDEEFLGAPQAASGTSTDTAQPHRPGKEPTEPVRTLTR